MTLSATPRLVSCRHRGVRFPQSRPVNGVRMDSMTRRSLLEQIHGFIACGQSHVVQFLAADPSVIAMTDPEYRDLLNRGDLNVADGFPVELGLRWRGVRTERIPGSDALSLIAEWSQNRNLRHYFYGGTEDVGPMLQDRLKQDFPSITIGGFEAPPFRPLTDNDYREAAERIRTANTDLLWIGLGTPKQHAAAEHLRALDAAPVILCVGAAFDFIAGAKRRAPKWMQRAGLEWLHRLGSEPRRLWRRYLVGNPRFVWGFVSERLGIRRNASNSHD